MNDITPRVRMKVKVSTARIAMGLIDDILSGRVKLGDSPGAEYHETLGGA